MPPALTLFGGHGFIGARLAEHAARHGREVRCIGRDSWPESGSDLGDVIFTIGMTAGFRQRLTETVEMQVVRVHEALTRYRFDSFLYLSSTRVYAGAAHTHEDAALSVYPGDPDQIYNISKLAGEALCLAQANARVRVARLSNVFGPGEGSASFLASVLTTAAATGHVEIGQSPASAKDYVALDDVVPALLAISERGRSRLYNVGSGRNTSHGEIAAMLESCGVRVSFSPDAPTIRFAPLDIARLSGEFGAPSGSLESHIHRSLAPSRPPSRILQS